MGLFDFIFGSKKKEQELLRLEEEARRQNLEQERIARERERRLEENRRKEQEFLFLNNLADAYRNYDVSYIENWLDDNMHYASMWVFQELKSKEEYLDYLSGKLQTMKERNTKMDFEIVKGGMHNHALLVKNQRSPEGAPIGFVADFNDKGKVVMLNITMSSFFLSSETKRRQDLLNEDELNKDLYFQVSKLLGEAILSNNFDEFQKYLSTDIVLTRYGKGSNIGISEVINYFREWIDRYGKPCNGTKYKVRYCKYFNRNALEIKPFRATPLFVVPRIDNGKIKDLFFAPNPLQPITIRYWDLNNEALSFKKDPYLSQNLGEDLEPRQNRMPCMRCGTRSEKLQWYKYHYDRGPLAYDGELSVCPNCMETVEYYPDTLYRK